MSLRNVLLLSGAALFFANVGAQAQVDEPTIRAIPDPEADLPDAVTDQVPFPEDTAAPEGLSHSEAGRSGERRDDGLDTAREAAADGLEHAEDAAAGNREEFGRSHAPEDLPDQVPDSPPDDTPVTPDQVPDQIPPDPPTSG